MITFREEVVARFWTHGETHASCTIRSVEGDEVHQAHISWFPNTMLGGINMIRPGMPGHHLKHRTARPALSYRHDRVLETGPRTAQRFESQEAYDSALQDANDLWNIVSAMQNAAQRQQHAEETLADIEYELQAHETKAKTLTARDLAKFTYGKKFGEAILEALGDPTLQTPPRFPPIEANRAFDRARADANRQKETDEGLGTGAAEKICVPGVRTTARYLRVKRNRVVGPAAGGIVTALSARFPEGSDVLWGLNLHAVLEFWIAFLGDHRHGYQFASTRHNCAGVVLSALKAGGVGAYVSTDTGWLGGDSLLFVRPAEVNAIVTSLVHAMDGVNRDTREFMSSIDAQPGPKLFDEIGLVDGDLWSAREFAAQSKSPNKLSLRREQVGQIDKALTAYHRAGRGFTRENFETKLHHLINMMYYICDHRRTKPQSDRRRGVDSLGVQICKLILANPIGRIYAESLGELIKRANEAGQRRVNETVARQDALRAR